MSENTDEIFKLCRCLSCGAFSFPHNTYACRVCGSHGESLMVDDLPGEVTLVNFVTVHAPIIKNIPVPFVVGEVQLAPGVIEEAVMKVTDESELQIGMVLNPIRNTDPAMQVQWVFAPQKDKVCQ